MAEIKTIELADGETKALAVVLNTPGKRVNVFDEPTVRALAHAVATVSGNISSLVTAVIFCSAKHGSFCHGADVAFQQTISSEAVATEAVRDFKRILHAIEALPVPTIAYINGVALGGGLELALACDYRFAARDAAKAIGLPEVQLGLLPGAGGCVRLPRLIGLFAGVQLLLAGKTLDAPRAHKAGVITGVLASQSLTWPLPETEHPTAAHAAPQPAGFASHLQALKAAIKH